MKTENENENLEPEVLGTDTKSENNVSALDATQDALSELALEALENSPMKEEESEMVTANETTPVVPPVPPIQTTPVESTPVVPPVDSVQTTPMAPPVTPIPNNNLEEPKKKNTLPIIILGLIAIAAIAFGVYYFFFQKDLTPKERYTKILNDAYASVSPYLTNDMEYDFKKPFALNLDASMDTTMNGLKNFSGYHVTADLGFDMEGKKGSLQLSLQDKNKKDILSAKAGADDKNIYIASEKLYNKTIKVSNVTTEFWKTLKNPEALLKTNMPENVPAGKDIDHFIKLVKDKIIENIDENSIKTTEEKITIDEKEETVTKLSYVLDQKEEEKQFTAIFNAIKADETSMNLLATLTKKSKSEIEKTLDKALQKLNVTTPISFDLYVKNNDLVQVEFGISKDDLFRYTVNDKKSNITLTSKKEKIFEINIDETNKKETLVTVDMGYNITVKNQTVSGTINVNARKDKLSGAFSVTTTVKGNEMKVNMEMEVTPNVAVTLPTATNAIEYTQLTKADRATIMTNAQNAIKGTSLEALITSMMGTGDMHITESKDIHM